MIPEIWSAALLRALRKTLVYGQAGVINRNYDGEIGQAGDTVRINSVGRPTVKTYSAGTPIVREQLTDAQRVLVVDQQKYFAFDVDDINIRQAQGNIVSETMSEAAYALADVVDQFVASLYTQTIAANNLGTISVPVATPTDFYDKVLVPLSVKLDEANVPSEGRYCVAPPWLHGRGLLDPRFIKVNESGTEQGLRNGIVGRAAGFDILKSNNCPNPTGDDYVVQAGVGAAITFAEQINKTEGYRPHDTFSDAVKGLAVYGAKVIRPECLAVATVSQT
ncbi:P22 coat protein - protein 5 domain protein [Kibdelosporangium phytohabitans]|uniref:p22 coat protein-protein 5 domain protein n=2 Tax=Kibdelosporangium phytohabitans TaxID=860235 RepID=A0A0N9HS28_9PSEU|nr:P22 coat protein - protein 5 domain protein [Kibdelosporangium phytohabitans]ALG07715.1 P22 coat protein - protein 5 domain protein [Kibdelosporangium phytohabitans]